MGFSLNLTWLKPRLQKELRVGNRDFITCLLDQVVKKMEAISFQSIRSQRFPLHLPINQTDSVMLTAKCHQRCVLGLDICQSHNLFDWKNKEIHSVVLTTHDHAQSAGRDSGAIRGDRVHRAAQAIETEHLFHERRISARDRTVACTQQLC